MIPIFQQRCSSLVQTLKENNLGAATKVANNASNMIKAMSDCGCNLNNAFMQHSLLALVVIPELRISDLGLVDVTKFELTNVLVD